MVEVVKLDENLWRKSWGKVTLLTEGRSDNTIMAGLLVLEPGQRLPAEGFSQHLESDELAYIIEGAAIFGTESEEIEIKTSDFIFNPRGTKHYVRNDRDKPCKMIWALAPPIKL